MSMSTILIPFAWLLRQLYFLCNDYGIALIALTLVLRLVLTPFQMKSKKSTMKTSRLTPRVKELEAKYKDDKQKYNAEVQKLYKSEGVSPMSGCLWTIIPLVIMIVIYSVIRFPLTNLFQMPADMYATLYEKVVSLGFVYTGKNTAYEQIAVARYMGDVWPQVKDIVAGVLDKPIDFNFLGIDISRQPTLMFWKDLNWPAHKWDVIGCWLIPLVAGGSQLLASHVSQKMNQSVATNEKGEKISQAMAGTKTMLYTMPLISIWFAFVMPAGIGVYWIASAIFGMIQDAWLTHHYRTMYDREDEVKRAKAAEEAEKEAARQAERERRAAEGIKEVNPNTSKKKLATQQKITSSSVVHEKPLDKMSPKELAEYWTKVAAQEEVKSKKPSSASGSASGRKYAKGRNYDPSRYADNSGKPAVEEMSNDKAPSETPAAANIPEITPSEETTVPKSADMTEVPEFKTSDQLSAEYDVSDDLSDNIISTGEHSEAGEGYAAAEETSTQEDDVSHE